MLLRPRLRDGLALSGLSEQAAGTRGSRRPTPACWTAPRWTGVGPC
ncbi:MAG: hypothetical protein U0R72_16560 [Nakamurella multipartita]